MDSCIVILSGGLDSSTNLVMALEHLSVKLALTFDYGQRAAAKEINAASQLCQFYQVTHKVISLPWVASFGQSTLINRNSEVPTFEVNIDDLKISSQTASKVWVPNRNGILLNIAAGFAESLACKYIIPGFNQEEAATFPDNSEEFIYALNQSFLFSTANHVQVKCFTKNMMKTEIVKEAVVRKLPLNMIWPCYLNNEKWCGRCESCQRSKRAFIANGIELSLYFEMV